MDKLEQKFNENLTEWRKHMIKTMHSSNHADYINCEAYRNIIAMGKSVLPLIRREYEKSTDHQNMEDPGVCWCYAVKAIVPEFDLSVGDRGSGSAVERIGGFIGIDIDKAREETLNWLDKNMKRYIQ